MNLEKKNPGVWIRSSQENGLLLPPDLTWLTDQQWSNQSRVNIPDAVHMRGVGIS